MIQFRPVLELQRSACTAALPSILTALLTAGVAVVSARQLSPDGRGAFSLIIALVDSHRQYARWSILAKMPSRGKPRPSCLTFVHGFGVLVVLVQILLTVYSRGLLFLARD